MENCSFWGYWSGVWGLKVRLNRKGGAAFPFYPLQSEVCWTSSEEAALTFNFSSQNEVVCWQGLAPEHPVENAVKFVVVWSSEIQRSSSSSGEKPLWASFQTFYSPHIQILGFLLRPNPAASPTDTQSQHASRLWVKNQVQIKKNNPFLTTKHHISGTN